MMIYDFKKNDAINVITPIPTTNSLLSIRNSKMDRTNPKRIIWIPINLNNPLFISNMLLKDKFYRLDTLL